MTIEEAREYWCKRLERAEGYSDEHWDAEERHAHADYVDAMTHAITALAICREREEAEKNIKTNADRIRQMTDEELAEFIVRQLIRGAIHAHDIYDMECIKSIEDVVINSACWKKDIEAALAAHEVVSISIGASIVRRARFLT